MSVFNRPVYKRKRTPITVLMHIVFCALTFCSTSFASVDIELDVPSWKFTLGSIASEQPNLRISHDERELLNTILPLVEKGKVVQALRRFEQEDTDSLSIKMRELYGQVLLNNKRYEEAKTTLLAIVKDVPTLASAHRSLSVVYLMTNELEMAQRHLTRCVELGVNDAQVFGQLAYTNLQLGKAVTAINGYQQALLLQPDNPQWYQGLLFAFIQSDSLTQADSLLEQMLSETPQDRQLWLQRGQLALKQNNKTRAISSLETALTLGDKSVSNLIMLSKLHVSSGSVLRAANLLADYSNILLTDNTGEGVKAYIDVATYLMNAQKWSLLKTSLSSAASHLAGLNSLNKAQITVLRAQLFAAQGHDKEAITYLQDAIKIMPDNGEALLAMAQLYRKQKRIPQAKIMFTRAQALEETRQRAMLGQAQMAIEQHDYSSALALLRDVVKAYPSRSDLLANIAALEKILKHAV